MSDHDLRRQAREIREALERFDRDQLINILSHVFSHYVMQGGEDISVSPRGTHGTGGSAGLGELSELAGLPFARLIERLQLRLDLPELQLFEVQDGKVHVRVGGRLVPVDAPGKPREPLPLPGNVAAANPAPPTPSSAAPAPAAPGVYAAPAAPPAATGLSSAAASAAPAASAPAASPPPAVGHAGAQRPDVPPSRPAIRPAAGSAAGQPGGPADPPRSAQPAQPAKEDRPSDEGGRTFLDAGDRLMSAVVARRYYVRGIVELTRGHYDDASRDLAEVVRLHPDFVEARVALARALVGLSDAPRAAQVLRTGLHHDPLPRERGLLHRALGDTLLTTGDYTGAEQALAEAARHGGGDADLHDRLARLRARTGRFADAFDELLRAARFSRGSD